MVALDWPAPDGSGSATAASASVPWSWRWSPSSSAGRSLLDRSSRRRRSSSPLFARRDPTNSRAGFSTRSRPSGAAGTLRVRGGRRELRPARASRRSFAAPRRRVSSSTARRRSSSRRRGRRQIVVVARREGSTGRRGHRTVRRARRSGGLEIRPMASLDATRELAAVNLSSVAVGADSALGEPGSCAGGPAENPRRGDDGARRRDGRHLPGDRRHPPRIREDTASSSA